MNIELKKFAAVAYSTKETIQHTYDMTKYCLDNNIKGSFVECGVAAGAQIGVMGYVLDSQNNNSEIYAFDSFKGIPFCSENDDQEAGLYYLTERKPFVEDKETLLVSTGATVHPLDSVVSNITNWGLDLSRYRFVEGWFQHTLKDNQIESISLLRLDGDLYESTLVCLQYLYPLVAEGGVVIIDDYALEGCKKAVEDYFNGNLPEILTVEGGMGVSYFYKK